MTKFDIIRNLINSKKKNDVITRHEMLSATETTGYTCSYGTTADNIRRVLTLNQVLSEPIQPGHYHVLLHIKSHIKYGDLRKMAYRQSWKTWFMKPEFFIDIE